MVWPFFVRKMAHEIHEISGFGLPSLSCFAKSGPMRHIGWTPLYAVAEGQLLIVGFLRFLGDSHGRLAAFLPVSLPLVHVERRDLVL